MEPAEPAVIESPRTPGDRSVYHPIAASAPGVGPVCHLPDAPPPGVIGKRRRQFWITPGVIGKRRRQFWIAPGVIGKRRRQFWITPGVFGKRRRQFWITPGRLRASSEASTADSTVTGLAKAVSRCGRKGPGGHAVAARACANPFALGGSDQASAAASGVTSDVSDVDASDVAASGLDSSDDDSAAVACSEGRS